MSQINVFELPPVSTFSSNPSAAISPAPLLSLSTTTSKPIDTLAFHPTASSLLLASSGQTLSIYDIESQSKSPVFELDAIASSSWSAQWSGDGKYVSATGKDGKLRLWDVRTDPNKVVAVSSSDKRVSLDLFTDRISCMRYDRKYSLTLVRKLLDTFICRILRLDLKFSRLGSLELGIVNIPYSIVDI